MTHYLRLGATPFFLALCLILGGASAAGLWANMALQLLAIPLILWAVLGERRSHVSTPARQLIWILLLLITLIAIQLVPLPPSIWTRLPGRQSVTEGLLMIGQPLPWMPLSLDRYATIASALWLLPAIAVLLGIIRLGSYRASGLAWVLAGVTIVSVAVGALQIAGGPESPAYLYEITNFGDSTGFFSNANHLATLMVATMPFLAALYLSAIARGRSMKKSSGLLVVLAGALTVLIVGIVINHSIAGVALSVPVLAASIFMLVSRKRRVPIWAAPVLAILLLGSVAMAFSAPFKNNLTVASEQAKEDSRYNSFRHSLAEARLFMPVGSGIGTFQQLYRTTEDPEQVDSFYMNHVHGDYIEIALETGLPGLVLVVLFLLWWGRRAAAIWSADEPDHFARAATVASVAILTHSIVDYPLRTAAISALFAMCCALMAEPRARVKPTAQADPSSEARHLAAD
jgi:O-antigen ligase